MTKVSPKYRNTILYDPFIAVAKSIIFEAFYDYAHKPEQREEIADWFNSEQAKLFLNVIGFGEKDVNEALKNCDIILSKRWRKE